MVAAAVVVDVDRAANAAVSRTDLPNGLTVLSEHVPGVRSVAFGAWVRAATVHENAEQMGVSHLLEHMVFKGTAKRSAAEIALSLETLGGSLDAYTEREHTAYQARVLDEHLDTAVDVIADLVFRPALRDSDLKLERKVILEEISMVDDTPDDIIFDVHNKQLWGDHSHGFPILGTRETVKALQTSHLRALHERAYHPGRIVVAAAGNVSHDRLLDVLQQTGWHDQRQGDSSPLPIAPVTAVAVHAHHVKRTDIAQTHVVLGSPSITQGDPRRYAFGLLSMLLGGGMSSKLFQRVREELGLAYSVHTFHSPFKDAGVHGVYLASAPESAQEALDAVRMVLTEAAINGLSNTEIVAGKQQLRGQLVLSMESVSSRMYRAAASALYAEPVRTLEETMALVDAIDAETVAAVARDFFAPEKQTLVSLGPQAVH